MSQTKRGRRKPPLHLTVVEVVGENSEDSQKKPNICLMFTRTGTIAESHRRMIAAFQL